MAGKTGDGGKVHLVGSIAMDNCEEVFSRVSETLGPYLDRIPDGETGERSRWIYFQREMLMQHPAMEIDPTVPELELHQWDGKRLRSLPLLRFREGTDIDSLEFSTGYDEAAAHSYKIFTQLKADGRIAEHARFQVCLPTPMASGYMYISHRAHDEYFRVYERSLMNALHNIVEGIPNSELALQYDVCQEVLLFEDYFPNRPADYKEQVFSMLGRLGDAVPENTDLGYHLCYGTPYDEHLVMPKDMGILVELMNGVSDAVKRHIDYFHMPVPKTRSDDAYFEPLAQRRVSDATRIYLGLIHHDDEQGDQLRMQTASRYLDDFGISTECGWGRSDPKKVPGLLDSHARAARQI